MSRSLQLKIGIIAIIITAAAFSRVIPHMLNFSPLGAIALFGAAHFSRKWLALAIPILATWLSDLYINNVVFAADYPEFTLFYSGFYWQYGSYALIILLGLFLFRKKISVLNVFGGAIGAGLIFFLVSNFGVWATGSLYPKSISGLISCYAAGLPFYKGTLLGDLAYSTVLFGAYYLLQQYFKVLQPTHVVYALK